jgi:DHA1 family inner membrane transport protein
MALWALGLGAFTIGTAELLVIGVLPLAAWDLRVPVSTGGLLVTAYAAGVSLGGPLVTAATIRVARRMVLWLALGLYAAGNVLAAAAPSFGILLVARVVTGTVHGVFIGAASAVAASLVPPNRRGRAMSMVFGGIAASTVFGVPLGTLAGQVLGWRAAFAGVVILGVLALTAVVAFVPPVAGRGSGGLAAQIRHAFAPPVLAMLGFGLVVIGGQFAALTYLTPFLARMSGVAGWLVSFFLLAYGAAAAVGTAIGGRMADRSPVVTVTGASVVLGLLLAGGQVPALALTALVLWGLAGFGLVPAFSCGSSVWLAKAAI